MNKNCNTPIKAVLYARIFNNYMLCEGLDIQIRKIRKYAEENNIDIIHEYVEPFDSRNVNGRIEFQKMISDSKNGEFKVILVSAMNRFAHNRKECIFHKIDLKRNGVKVISVTEPISDSPEGVILESMLEAFAEYYSLNLAEDKTKIKETDGYLSQEGNHPNERHS